MKARSRPSPSFLSSPASLGVAEHTPASRRDEADEQANQERRATLRAVGRLFQAVDFNLEFSAAAQILVAIALHGGERRLDVRDLLLEFTERGEGDGTARGDGAGDVLP